MKIYIRSSVSSAKFNLGKGYHESSRLAARENVDEDTVKQFFKSLLAAGMAEDNEDVPETATNPPANPTQKVRKK